MRKIFPTGTFSRDVKRMARRKCDMSALYAIIEYLRVGKNISLTSRPHKLQGKYEGCWECHIESDWLLIWEYDNDAIILTRTGSHADLFE
ncbi:MAG: type II toxin-antitoxin system YafQ family toxin [Candidatus Paceibacterota bacterium]|jgi:mRNA interferase YafQ